MDPVTIIGLVQTCYLAGVKVIEICSAWKNAATEVQSRVIAVEACWHKTQLQVKLVGNITSLMGAELSQMMDEILRELFHKLSEAASTLQNVIQRASTSKPNVFRFRFRAKAAWVWEKEALDSVICDLEEWQRRYDPTWFLVIKLASPLVDVELAKAAAAEPKIQGVPTAARNPLALAERVRKVQSPTTEQMKSVFLPSSDMEWMDIPFSEAKGGRRPQEARWYIVDTIEVGEAARVRDVAQDVRVLAAKLAQADPLAFGLLNCKGAIPLRQQPVSQPAAQNAELTAPAPPSRARSRSPGPGQNDYTHFQIIFRIPDGIQLEDLQSLRQLLLNSDAQMSLSRKVHMARELSKAVHYVHTLAFVHKNIRPESVLCCEVPEGTGTRSHSFLVGFDAFRAVDAGSLMGGDMSWAGNVYRHPSRQGADPSQKYKMYHDIYSLGVCLLEIGLWESFVEYEDTQGTGGASRAKFGKTYNDFGAWCQRQKLAPSFDAVATGLKEYLVEQAKTRLAPRMGDRYSQVVAACLTCLDDDNDSFGGPEEQGEGHVAVQFVEVVLKTLDKICV
ncbi:uncharacterized protein DSM5745_00345 [Aspergillus mulundensis]|uniref:Protein kinase domain-containing protein n=1 Tax=Aspergillus mulundensis TaxID=1810919 RepID=A0A3D8T394_9EURO|nr:Uncharacterized protein DSM5745_00345 [Aspergillus mulundensis]RDW93023.1 Uncharacterized protein DSM5745_00345 [Aspergillus mulundensis]